MSNSPSLYLSIVLSLLQSLDELDDDDPVEKERREEEEDLVQANTFQNEAMTADPTTGHLLLVRQSSNSFLSRRVGVAQGAAAQPTVLNEYLRSSL